MAIIAGAFFLYGCETSEDRAIMNAQKCLNNLSSAPTPPEVDICIAMLGSLDTGQANNIKCGAYFLRGGLHNSKIADAFTAFKEKPTGQKEAALIGLLALNTRADADLAFNFCKKSNSPGLMYIAGLARMGTIMKLAYPGQTDPEQIVNDCKTDSSGCDPEAIGEMAILVESQYCKGDNKDTKICSDLASSIAAGGGNLTAIGEALFGFIGF